MTASLLIALANLDIIAIGVALAFLACFGAGVHRYFQGPQKCFENPGNRERLGLLTEDRMERAERTRRAIAREQSLKAERARMEEAA